MPSMSVEEQAQFLDEPGILMRIATVRADGGPLVTPIWFLFEAGFIYFTPRAQSQWFQCLRDDPRVALCIDEQPLPYRKVVVQGAAELVHDLGADDVWRDLYLRIACRYVERKGAEAYLRNTGDQTRALFRIDMSQSQVRNWRMPVDDEPADGIWHQRYYAPGTQYSRSGA